MPQGEVADLATLTNLNADTLLQELHVRYEKDVIYVGDPSHTADCPDLCQRHSCCREPLQEASHLRKGGLLSSMFTSLNMKVMETYTDKQRKDVPPHVYVISDACYQNLFRMKKNQCAVIR